MGIIKAKLIFYLWGTKKGEIIEGLWTIYNIPTLKKMRAKANMTKYKGLTKLNIMHNTHLLKSDY